MKLKAAFSVSLNRLSGILLQGLAIAELKEGSGFRSEFFELDIPIFQFLDFSLRDWLKPFPLFFAMQFSEMQKACFILKPVPHYRIIGLECAFARSAFL